MSQEIFIQLQSRFTLIVNSKFEFLHKEFNFTACGFQSANLDDIRDARIFCRFVRGHMQLEVSLTLGILQPSVYLRQYAGLARCSIDVGALKVICLEQFAASRGNTIAPPLAWMKSPTFYEEASRAYRHFSKHMLTDIEPAITYLAGLTKKFLPELLTAD